MTHSRRGFERCFDLAERIVLPEHNRTASVADAEVYFARHAMQELGIADMRTWRTSFMNAIERKVSLQEAADRLEALLAAGEITQIKLDPSSETTNGKTIRKQDPIRYMLSSDVPLLEEVQAGCVPAEWKPIGPATNEETSFLAPLDIVSARGRALPVFGFNYKWELYTPVIQRHWGYYVLPALFCD